MSENHNIEGLLIPPHPEKIINKLTLMTESGELLWGDVRTDGVRSAWKAGKNGVDLVLSQQTELDVVQSNRAQMAVHRPVYSLKIDDVDIGTSEQLTPLVRVLERIDLIKFLEISLKTLFPDGLD